MSSSNDRGRYTWYELHTTDPDAGTSFYKAVVGWSAQPFGDGSTPYTMFVGSRGPVAGAMMLADEARAMGAPPHWVAYVNVPSAADSAAQAVALGGQVLVGPFQQPGIGHMAFIRDPQGAVVAIHQPESAMAPAHPTTEPGEGCWAELMSTDPDGGYAFYEAMFGWNKTGAMDMGPMGTYQMFGRGEPSLGGIMRKPDHMPMSAWLYYFHVADLDSALQTVQKLGGKVLNGPHEVPGGDRVAQCLDPQGAAFALFGRGAAA